MQENTPRQRILHKSLHKDHTVGQTNKVSTETISSMLGGDIHHHTVVFQLHIRPTDCIKVLAEMRF